MKFGMEINLNAAKVMTMAGTKKMEVELDGQQLEQFNVPLSNSRRDRKTRKVCKIIKQ